MFQTFDHAKISLPFSATDVSAWAYIELMVNSHFFLADCIIREESEEAGTSYLLYNLGLLGELRTNPNVSIKGLYVVSPPLMNASESWRMDRVSMVSSGVIIEDDYKLKMEIYELCNGKKYYSTNVDGKENMIDELSVIFSD